MIFFDKNNRMEEKSEPDEMMHADGFEAACMGVAEGFGGRRVIVYSYQKCLDILTKQHGMCADSAEDWMSHNLLGSWVGKGSPLVLHEMDFPQVREYAEEEGL